MKTLVSSIAVQMTTFPIMLRIYGEISLAGFFLNLLVLPTVSVVLVSGIAAIVVGMASVGVAVYVVLPRKSAAFFCMRNSANWQQEFRSVHGSQEVRSCGNVPDIMYYCFWELEFWE